MVSEKSDYMSEKYRDVLKDITGAKPYKPDELGYSYQFQCIRCERIITLTYPKRDCDYNYCPWCGREII